MTTMHNEDITFIIKYNIEHYSYAKWVYLKKINANNWRQCKQLEAFQISKMGKTILST